MLRPHFKSRLHLLVYVPLDERVSSFSTQEALAWCLFHSSSLAFDLLHSHFSLELLASVYQLAINKVFELCVRSDVWEVLRG